jgi:hypothetical protein
MSKLNLEAASEVASFMAKDENHPEMLMSMIRAFLAAQEIMHRKEGDITVVMPVCEYDSLDVKANINKSVQVSVVVCSGNEKITAENKTLDGQSFVSRDRKFANAIALESDKENCAVFPEENQGDSTSKSKAS